MAKGNLSAPSSPNKPVRTAAKKPTNGPSVAERRYLERGLDQPGHKLPLFDGAGQEIPKKTIDSCIAKGWAEPWFNNPVKPDWLVCRLTEKGVLVLQSAG